MSVRDLDHFQNWLTDCGAEVLATISEWEVLRVRTSTGTHVVYSNKGGVQRWPAGLIEIVSSYNKGVPLALAATRRKRKAGKLFRDFAPLIRRDGDGCFYCGQILAPPGTPVPSGWEVTTEHLVCVAHGGPDHLSNKFLAHLKCNNIAGSLSAPEKKIFREEMQRERRG